MFDFVIPWCSLPGSSVHEISQARILEWVVGFCHLFPSFCIFTYCLCLLYLLPRVQVPHMSSSAIPFSFWKTEGKRRRGRHRMRWLDSITDWLWTRGPSSPWDLLKQGIELWFPALSGEFFTTAPPGKPISNNCSYTNQIMKIQLVMKSVARSLDILQHLMKIRSDHITSVQSLSHVQLFMTMNRSTPGLPVHHQLLELTQTHIHRVIDAIQPSHPLSSPSPPAPNPSHHQSLFQWVNSSHEVAKVLEFQL